MATILCPVCRKTLESVGIVSSSGRDLTVYQCDTCIRSWEFGGRQFDALLTFAVDQDGNAFDPETFEPVTLPPGPVSLN